MNGIDETFAADLIDMQAFSKENNGIKYLLTVIDIFSKYVWTIPIKRKTRQKVASTFSRILKERRHSKIWLDKGGEFFNKDVRKLVELYCTEKEEKSYVIKRFNRTIKEKCLCISLIIIQENLLMYLTYLLIGTIMQYIPQ